MDHQEIKIWKRDLGRQSWNVVASLFHAGKNSFRNISPCSCDFCSCEVPLDRGSSIDPSSTIISLSTKLAFRSLFGTPLQLFSSIFASDAPKTPHTSAAQVPIKRP